MYVFSTHIFIYSCFLSVVRSFVCLFVCSFVRFFCVYSFICSFFCLFVCLFFRLFWCLFLHSFVHSFVFFLCLFIHLFVRSFVRFCVYLFIHSFVRSFVRLFLCLFVCLFAYSFIHPFVAICCNLCARTVVQYLLMCLYVLFSDSHPAVPLLQQYWCSCCNGVPNIIKYRIWTETKHSSEYSASVSLIAFIYGGVISNVQTAVCDWLAEGTLEQLTRFFGGNVSNWQHSVKILVFN